MKNQLYKAGLILTLTGLTLSGCVMNKVSAEKEHIILKEDGQGRSISLNLDAGEGWSREMKAGPLVFNVLSQIVIWTEDADGRLLETIYVSGADFGKMRHAGKKEKGEAFFRESFPLWAKKMDAAGQKLPSPEEPYPDTITSATPSNDFTLETKLTESNPPFTIYAEINSSGDENEFFTKKLNDWAGQPALIYSAEVGEQSENYILELAGHSGLLNDKAMLYKDLSAFDSALGQVKQIKLSFTSN